MKLEDFLKIFGATDLTKVDEIVVEMERHQELLGQNLDKYIEKCGHQLNKQEEFNIVVIEQNFYIELLSVLKESGVNPFVALVPDIFLSENKLEQLEEYGDAMDKLFYANWIFFRMFFEKKRPFQYSLHELIGIMFKCIDETILTQECIKSQDLLENYPTYKTILHNKIEHIEVMLEYDVSLLAEYLSQIFPTEENAKIIEATLSSIVDTLSKYPYLVLNTVLESIYRMISFFDIESYDLYYHPPRETELIEKCKRIEPETEELKKQIEELEENARRELKIGLSIPQAIISEQYDPMKNKQFTKEDPDILERKLKEFNNFITNLSAWDCLMECSGLKYFDYKCKKDRLETAINDLK